MFSAKTQSACQTFMAKLGSSRRPTATPLPRRDPVTRLAEFAPDPRHTNNI